MTKREMRKQQKREALIEKVSNMSEKEFRHMQAKLKETDDKLLNVNAAFGGALGIGFIAGIITAGFGVFAITAAVMAVYAVSVAGIIATSLTRLATKIKHKRNSDAMNYLRKQKELETEVSTLDYGQNAEQRSEQSVKDEIVAAAVGRAVRQAEQGPSETKHYASLEEMIAENGYMGEINE